MGSLAEADQSRHVAHWNRRLLEQQLGSHVQSALAQLLMETNLAELDERPCQLTRRTGKRPRNPLVRQWVSIVAGDDHARL